MNKRLHVLNFIAERMLTDPEIEFSSEERADLIESMAAINDLDQLFTIQIPLTDAERERLQFLADEQGMSVSEYIRRKLFE